MRHFKSGNTFDIFILVRFLVFVNGCPSFSGNRINASISAHLFKFLDVEDFQYHD